MLSKSKEICEIRKDQFTIFNSSKNARKIKTCLYMCRDLPPYVDSVEKFVNGTRGYLFFFEYVKTLVKDKVTGDILCVRQELVFLGIDLGKLTWERYRERGVFDKEKRECKNIKYNAIFLDERTR